MANGKPRKYNVIFGELTKEPGDIVGLLAYGVYKREKIEHIKRFTEKCGRQPTDTDLQAFHGDSMGRTEQYRKLATIEMQTLYNEIAAEQAEAMYKQMFGSLEDTLQDLRPKWWPGIFQGVIGGYIFTLSLFVLLILCIAFLEGTPAAANALIKWLTKISGPAPMVP